MAFDDVRTALERLADAGYPIYVLTDGSPDLLACVVANATRWGRSNRTISVDEVETYQVGPEVDEHAAPRVGTPPEELTHVWSAGSAPPAR